MKPYTFPARWRLPLAVGAALLLVSLGLGSAVLGLRPPRGPAPAAATAGVAVPELVTGTVYREGLVGELATLNPLLARGAAERDLASLVFSSLTRGDGHGVPQPDLALSWRVDITGMIYTFNLRRDAYWHDGTSVTSRDVLTTVRLMQDDRVPVDAAQRALWRTVRVDLPSETQVVFTLSEPQAAFLAQTSFAILPSHRLRPVYPGDIAASDFSRKPVGSGPYQVVDGLGGSGALVLRRFDRYHGPLPAIERLLFRIYPSADAAAQALLADVVDGVGGLTPDQLSVLQGRGGLTVQGVPVNGHTTLLFNLRRAPFNQREVRQAVALAIDRQAIIATALSGHADSVSGPIAPSSWAYQPSQPREADLDAARALLDRAGWARSPATGSRSRDGRLLSVSLLTSDTPERSRAAQEIVRQLQSIGIQATVIAVTPALLTRRFLAPHDFDAALFGFSMLGADPDPYPFWHSSQAEQGFNFAGWSLPKADKLLEDARQTSNTATRRQLYAEFQSLFAEEAPAVVLYAPQYLMVVNQRVHPVLTDPIDQPADRFRDIARWIVEAEKAVG